MASSKDAGHVTSNVGGSPVFKPTVSRIDKSIAQPSPNAKEVKPLEEEAKATAEEVEKRREDAVEANTVSPEDGDVETHVSEKVEAKEAEEDTDEEEQTEGDEQEDE